MKKVLIIDGQGGKIGSAIIEQLKTQRPAQELIALGTNSIATSAMLRAGAHYGATGENPVISACRDADIIVGPLGILVADALLGEITPAMAAAVGQSRAQKILLPVNKCNHFVVGLSEKPFGELIDLTIKHILSIM